MRTAEHKFYKCYGNRSVIFRDGVEVQPFQPFDWADVKATRYFNRFSYESVNALYDVKVYTDGEVVYEKNMELSEKLPHHIAIEEFYQDEIAETIAA